VTIHRYQQFALLIEAYPRLLVCGLSFAQFSKHHDHLLKLFEVHRELAYRPKSHDTVSVQGKRVDVIRADLQRILRATIAPANHDYYYESV